MTIKEMVKTLVDKGHSQHYAEITSLTDRDALLREQYSAAQGTQECSVCRRNFTDLQMKYHYHPCE